MKTLIANRISQYDNESRQKRQILKKTRQKEAILKVLRNTTSHPTATWIYDEVRKELPYISLGTVYRNLRLLAARGEISKLEIAGDYRRFDANTSSRYHGRCDRCGQVFDIDESITERLDWEISRETDFMVSEYRLEFHGLCRKCQES